MTRCRSTRYEQRSATTRRHHTNASSSETYVSYETWYDELSLPAMTTLVKSGARSFVFLTHVVVWLEAEKEKEKEKEETRWRRGAEERGEGRKEKTGDYF